MTWHLLTGEYPPIIGGVSDYTFTMASSLGATGAEVHVWGPWTERAGPAASNVTVHPVLRSFSQSELQELDRALDSHPAPRVLFVQWTPQAFARRSLNVGFARWLSSRGRRSGDLVHLMVHEPFLPWSTRPSHLVGATVHRVMLTIAARRAAHVWVSTTTWIPMIRPFVPTHVPIDWLPIPGFMTPAAAPRTTSTEGAGIIGHFGTYSPLVVPLLERALDVVLERTSADVLLVGRDGDVFRRKFTATRPAVSDRIVATGAIGPDDVVAALGACDLMIQPYPDGITTRRSSAATALSLGIPIVTNAGHLTEDFWQASDAVAMVPAPDGRAVGERAAALLSDSDKRSELAAAGRELYRAHFAPPHAVALLTASIAATRHAA